tara:strand:- start:9143 stop:9406 length:264 start_codon:yes stop_codon:yes gene_type:complete
MKRKINNYLEENTKRYLSLSMSLLSDEEYDNLFLEIVDDVRNKFLKESEHDTANEIVEEYLEQTSKIWWNLLNKYRHIIKKQKETIL